LNKSWYKYGVTQTEEVQMHPLVVATPGFIQLAVPLPPLKPMAQSRRGGATVQLTIAPAELPKVMSVMVKPTTAIWFAPVVFVRQVVRLPVVQRLLHYQLA
jgi:hypothetical protein